MYLLSQCPGPRAALLLELFLCNIKLSAIQRLSNGCFNFLLTESRKGKRDLHHDTSTRISKKKNKTKYINK